MSASDKHINYSSNLQHHCAKIIRNHLGPDKALNKKEKQIDWIKKTGSLSQELPSSYITIDWGEKFQKNTNKKISGLEHGNKSLRRKQEIIRANHLTINCQKGQRNHLDQILHRNHHFTQVEVQV